MNLQLGAACNWAPNRLAECQGSFQPSPRQSRTALANISKRASALPHHLEVVAYLATCIIETPQNVSLDLGRNYSRPDYLPMVRSDAEYSSRLGLPIIIVNSGHRIEYYGNEPRVG